MLNRILSGLLAGVFCVLILSKICVSADSVVVIPMASGLFKGDQYLTVSSAAFTPESHEEEYWKPVFMYNFNGYLVAQSTLGQYVAPVNLPDGAIVSQFSTYIERQGGQCYMNFGKHTLNNRQYEHISDIVTTFDSQLSAGQYGPVHKNIANETIDNMNYQYHLAWVCGGLTGTDHLYAVRLKYRLR